MSISVCEAGIVGEFPRERAHDGGPGGVGEVECRVDVREESVADCSGGFGSGGNRGPAVGLLRDGGEDVVVPVEGEEGGELHPAGT